MKRLFPLLLLCLVFAACRHPGAPGQADSPGLINSTDTSAWVTFSGTLPCADCEGIATELSLENRSADEEHHFKLKETYQGKNQTLRSEGTFVILNGTPSDAGASVIQLNPDKDRNLQRYFQQIGESELKMLDSDQKTIESSLNYTLKKVL